MNLSQNTEIKLDLNKPEENARNVLFSKQSNSDLVNYKPNIPQILNGTLKSV